MQDVYNTFGVYGQDDGEILFPNAAVTDSRGRVLCWLLDSSIGFVRCCRPPSLVILAFPGMGPATARISREKQRRQQRVFSVGLRPPDNLRHPTKNALEGVPGKKIQLRHVTPRKRRESNCDAGLCWPHNPLRRRNCE